MTDKKKPGRPSTGGRKRNKKLPAFFTEDEIEEIKGICDFVGKTQADTVLDGVRKLEKDEVIK